MVINAQGNNEAQSTEPGTALLLAAAPAGRAGLIDAVSVLPTLAAVPPSVLAGTAAASVVELADPLDPQAVLTRLRTATAQPGPLHLYIAGQLHLDHRQRLLHLALARTTPSTLRYTGLPWHWLTGELTLRRPHTTTVVLDLVADAEAWKQVGVSGLGLGHGTSVFGRVLPPPPRRTTLTPTYLRAYADIWRTGARPTPPALHETAASHAGPPDALFVSLGSGHVPTPVAGAGHAGEPVPVAGTGHVSFTPEPAEPALTGHPAESEPTAALAAAAPGASTGTAPSAPAPFAGPPGASASGGGAGSGPVPVPSVTPAADAGAVSARTVGSVRSSSLAAGVGADSGRAVGSVPASASAAATGTGSGRVADAGPSEGSGDGAAESGGAAPVSASTPISVAQSAAHPASAPDPVHGPASAPVAMPAPSPVSAPAPDRASTSGSRPTQAPAQTTAPASVPAPSPGSAPAPDRASTSGSRPTQAPAQTTASASATAPASAAASAPAALPAPATAPAPAASAPVTVPAPAAASAPAASPAPASVPAAAVQLAKGPVAAPRAPSVPASVPAVPPMPTTAPVVPAPVGAGEPDPHALLLAAVQAGRHGEAASIAAAWEGEALRVYGMRSSQVVHWMEVRADLARLADEPGRSCELWIAVAHARIARGETPSDEDVEAAVDRAHHQFEQVSDPDRARGHAAGLIALREQVPGRRPGALDAIKRRLDALSAQPRKP